jgi:pimeloyl-ACP methyl ester carboxylesterase
MALFTQEFGLSNAPTIVFLHGGGVGGWMWKPQIAQLQGEYHLLVPDLPEHGQSIEVKPCTLQNAAAQVADLIRTRAHGGRAHVVGLSLGAQTTIELLSQSPEVVDRAVASGPLMRPLPGIGTTNLMAKMYWPFRNMKWLVKWNMQGLGVPAEYFEEFRKDTASLTIDGFVRMTMANGNNHVPPNLQAVTVPTLLLVGEKELKIMKESVRDLLAVMPSAQGYIVSGAIHNWSMQLPDLFTQTVKAWIAGKTLPGALVTLQG